MQFITEITIPVDKHDRLYVDYLRIVIDRFGIILNDGEDIKIPGTNLKVGVRLIIEAWNNTDGVISRKTYEGELANKQLYRQFRDIALESFPDSTGGGLKEKK